MHLALQKTLSLAVESKSASRVNGILAKGLDITIVGGNDFYSQQDQVLSPMLYLLHQLLNKSHNL